MTVPPPTSAEEPSERAPGTPVSLPPAATRAVNAAKRFRRIVGMVPTPLIFAIGIAIAVVILWRNGSLQDVLDTVKRADPIEIAAGALLYVAGLWLLCVRWNILVKMIGGKADLLKSSEAFLTSVALNYIAPVSVAIPARAALTKRALGLTTSQTGAVVLWELVADVLVLAAGALLWLLITAGSSAALDSVPVPLLVTLAILVVAAVGVLALSVARHAGLRRRLITAASDMLAAPKRQPAAAITSLAVTVAFWVIQAGVISLLLGALGGDRHLRLLLGTTTLPWLVGMLSMVPGGTGVREAMMVAVARVEGAVAAPALVAAVTYRICLFAAIPVLYVLVRVLLSRRPKPAHSTETHDDAASGLNKSGMSEKRFASHR